MRPYMIMCNGRYRRVVQAVTGHQTHCSAHILAEERERCENIAAVGHKVSVVVGRATMVGPIRISGVQAALGFSSSEFEPLLLRLICPSYMDVKGFRGLVSM
jgi:hypothetical protein